MRKEKKEIRQGFLQNWRSRDNTCYEYLCSALTAKNHDT